MKLKTFNILVPIIGIFQIIYFWNNIQYLRIVGICWLIAIMLLANIDPLSKFAKRGER